MSKSEQPPVAPTLRVFRGGEPTDEELAALVAAISVRSATTAAEERKLREPLSPWVKSGLLKGTRTKA
jgi:hypothetical protein